MSVNFDDIDYVLIQAGGIGSRMGKYTENKSKCLVPYKGKTIIQHCIDFFKGKKIFIICDYKKDLLITYIKYVLKYDDVIFIETKEKSTTAGLNQFFNLIGNNVPFIFTWSDLIFEKEIKCSFDNPITIGLSDDVTCRWSFEGNQMVKKTSDTNGVVGFFVILSKEYLKNIDETKSFVGGNLVNLPKENLGIKKIEGLLEIGTTTNYENILNKSSKCRFFNEVIIKEDKVYKNCIDTKYEDLINNEINWYKYLNNKVNFIPTLLSENPMTITKINGKHLFDKEWSENEKVMIIESMISNLNKIHAIDSIQPLESDLIEIYFNKTIDRINSVKDVIPFFNNEFILIDGINCKNPFFGSDTNAIFDAMKSISSLVDRYHVIHGDPTFSNILVTNECSTFLIDPRGIFGKTKIYGDKNYDWAKLFYSVNGNYDSINSKKFNVKIDKDGVWLNIQSNKFEHLSDIITIASGMSKNDMYIHQALIWFSLTGYVKEDIDSIMYSFYYGVKQWNLIKD